MGLELHPAWGSLSVFDKYEVVTEKLAELDAKGSSIDPSGLDEKVELEELHFRIRAKATLLDPFWDMEHNLWVEDKNRKDVLMHPYPAQKKLISVIESARAEVSAAHPFGKPIRLYLPKTRRVGGTQAVAAYFYREWRNVRNTKALVMAHRDDSAVEIFEKYRTFWRKDPFRPAEERSSSKELLGLHTRSRLGVMTAGVSESSRGHGFGFTLFHGSEVDHYRVQNPARMMSGLLATVPTPNAAWSCVVLETTGNGRGGWFFNDVMTLLDIQNGGECPPELEYSKLLFLPSYERHDAYAPFATPKDAEKFVKSLTDEEMAILDKYRPEDISEEKFLEFLNWRRIVYANEIKGHSEADRRRRMREAHPIEIMDCFMASGGSAFNQDTISALQLKVSNQFSVGDLTARSSSWTEYDKTRLAHETPKARFHKDGSGPLRVMDRPRPGHRYCMGVDVAGGASQDEGDWSVAVVLDRDTRKIVARYRARIPGLKFVNVVRLLSHWYNDAVIGIEVNYDPSLVSMLAETDRREFLYQRQNPTGEDVNDALLPRFGWNTSPKTKAILISILREKLEHEPSIFTDPQLLHEMSVYQETYNPTTRRYKFGARSGDHDDTVMATAICLVVDADSWISSAEKPADMFKPKTLKEKWEEWVEEKQSENEDNTPPNAVGWEP